MIPGVHKQLHGATSAKASLSEIHSVLWGALSGSIYPKTAALFTLLWTSGDCHIRAKQQENRGRQKISEGAPLRVPLGEEGQKLPVWNSPELGLMRLST